MKNNGIHNSSLLDNTRGLEHQEINFWLKKHHFRGEFQQKYFKYQRELRIAQILYGDCNQAPNRWICRFRYREHAHKIWAKSDHWWPLEQPNIWSLLILFSSLSIFFCQLWTKFSSLQPFITATTETKISHSSTYTAEGQGHVAFFKKVIQALIGLTKRWHEAGWQRCGMRLATLRTRATF